MSLRVCPPPILGRRPRTKSGLGARVQGLRRRRLLPAPPRPRTAAPAHGSDGSPRRVRPGRRIRARGAAGDGGPRGDRRGRGGGPRGPPDPCAGMRPCVAPASASPAPAAQPGSPGRGGAARGDGARGDGPRSRPAGARSALSDPPVRPEPPARGALDAHCPPPPESPEEPGRGTRSWPFLQTVMGSLGALDPRDCALQHINTAPPRCGPSSSGGLGGSSQSSLGYAAPSLRRGVLTAPKPHSLLPPHPQVHSPCTPSHPFLVTKHDPHPPSRPECLTLPSHPGPQRPCLRARVPRPHGN